MSCLMFITLTSLGTQLCLEAKFFIRVKLFNKGLCKKHSPGYTKFEANWLRGS